MQTASPCPEAQQWERFGRGQVQPEDVDRLARHLEECPRCGSTMEQLLDRDALVEALRAVPVEIRQSEQDVLRRLADRVREFRPSDTDSTRAATRDEKLTPAEGPDPERTQELYDFLAPPQEAGELGRLGSYRVLKFLGAGGMGMVFQAEDSRLKRVVALKVILDARAADPGYLARFHQEAEVVARLWDPHIVQIYEVGKHRGRPYLALEYVGGGSLAQQLAGQPQPARPSAGLVQTLARAMHHAHQRGVVHRDLKPANVLLQRKTTTDDTDDTDKRKRGTSLSVPSVSPVVDSFPKIADFGLAKRLDEAGLTQTGELLGTPGYMAPELTRGQKEAGDSGPRVDVYSLGAILYELLTGRPPFHGATVLETLEQVRALDPVPVRRLQPKVPRDLQTVCLKCLEKDPARRYASAEALGDDLGRFLRGEPIRARAVSGREQLWKWVRRKPTLAALLTVCGLFLATLVAGGLVYSVGLRAAAEEAQQQRARADGNYREARNTLERMLARLESRQVGEVPQLKELQRHLREDALAFYQKALDRADSADPTVRLDMATASKRAADIQQALGRTEDAAANYRRTIDLVEGLPAEYREAADSQALLAGCSQNLGTQAVNARQWDEAKRQHRAALTICERLAREQPGDPERQYGVAESEHHLGVVCQLSGRQAEAKSHYTRAAGIHAELVRDHPEEERHQAALADDYVNLALIYQGTGQQAEAIRTYEKAEALLHSLVVRHAPGGDCALSLAGAYSNWGNLLWEAGQPQAGLARHTQAIDLAEAVLRQEPHHAVARSRAFNAHGSRAQCCEALGRWADAVRDWDRVVELDDAPGAWARQVLRALALARAGDHIRAAAQAEALAGNSEVMAEGVWELARVYALSVSPARSDARLPTADGAGLAERYAAGAVALLQKLQEQGYFKDAGHANALRTDKDLRPLRDRADFQKLLPEGARSKQG